MDREREKKIGKDKEEGKGGKAEKQMNIETNERRKKNRGTVNVLINIY